MSSVKVVGQRAVLLRLQKIRNNFSTIVRDVQLDQWLKRRTLARFDKGVSPDGSPWKKPEASTLRRRKYAGAGTKPLVRTGALRKAIDIIAGSREGLFTINTGLGFRIGINDPDISDYGRAHNEGLYSPMINKKLPQRRFIGIGPSDVRAAHDLLRRKAAEIIRG